MSIDRHVLALALCLIILPSSASPSEHGEAKGHEEPKEQGDAKGHGETKEHADSSHGHSAEHSDQPHLVERAARTSSRDVKIPRALVRKIEEDYRTYLKTLKVAEKAAFKRQMLNLSVELTQNRPVALHESVRILTPTGGGVIDLSEFVTPIRGSFKFKMKAKGDKGGEAEELRIFFISRAKKRKILGDDFGAGCNKMMEVTSYLRKKDAQDGITLYTADQRYLSVIGGTFVLFAFNPEGLSVGSLTFSDSRYPEVMCG